MSCRRQEAGPLAPTPKCGVQKKSSRKREKQKKPDHEKDPLIQLKTLMAASRREDRSLEDKMESALRASKLHEKLYGTALRITKEAVENGKDFEEVPNPRLMQARIHAEKNVKQNEDLTRDLLASSWRHQLTSYDYTPPRIVPSGYHQGADNVYGISPAIPPFNTQAMAPCPVHPTFRAFGEAGELRGMPPASLAQQQHLVTPPYTPLTPLEDISWGAWLEGYDSMMALKLDD